MLAAGVLGALPVLAVLGAVPGRRPTMLIEWMFRGFTACALDTGALNPVRMVCDRAGVPLGMYQLDGGLTYPLGGLLVRLGVEPLAAWKVAVAVPMVVGFAALYWLCRRLAGSMPAAAALVALVACNGTLTARTWNWYWNTVAVALLPVVFATLYVLFVRARRVRTGRSPATALAGPALACVAAVVLIGIEWQYAGVFAVSIAIGALLLLAVERGWPRRTRAAVFACGGLAVATVAIVLQWRLSIAGIDDQFGGSLANAADEGIDLVSFLVPDGSGSLLGLALRSLGLDGMLAGTLSDGRMLWITPYVGVGLLTLVVVLLVRRRALPADDTRCPRSFLLLLVAVAVASLVLSLGPQWRVAGLALPDAHVASPLRWLWTATPMRWIRYPWTWNSLTFLAGVLVLGAVVPTLFRDRDRWSPTVWGAVALALVELVSPEVLATVVQAAPSVAHAPSRLSLDDPVIARFDAERIPELRRALADAGGTVTLLPWGNTWVTPYLGPAVGIPMRNVGIDRNVSQVEAAAPVTRAQLRGQRGVVVDRIFRDGWTDTVVVVDYIPFAEYIARHTAGALLRIDRAQLQRNARTVRESERRGYCAERHPWFTVLTDCRHAS